MCASRWFTGMFLCLVVGWVSGVAPVRADCEWLPSDGVPALNGTVRAATVWDDGSGPALYLGGLFTMAGDLQVNGIVKWDGTQWTALGGGMDNAVRALAVFNGELIAGGWFTSAGSVSANYIAKWNGTSWSEMSGGMTCSSFPYPSVISLAVHNGELIAGGRFTSAGGVPANNIAKWNGTGWSALGDGTNGINPSVCALATFNGKLFAGGDFTSAGGQSCLRVAMWDGSAWAPLGGGVSQPGSPSYGWVDALAVWNGELIVGGAFARAGGVNANGIARWNGTTWAPLGGGNTGVSSLTVFHNDLIVGGYFTTAGDVSANSIARWNGTTWSPLGAGMAGQWADVETVTVFNDQLVAGGEFTSVDDHASPYWARWSCHQGHIDIGDPVDFTDGLDVSGLEQPTGRP
jgi:hypothetical protein